MRNNTAESEEKIVEIELNKTILQTKKHRKKRNSDQVFEQIEYEIEIGLVHMF